MWEMESLTIAQSLLISGAGMLVVVCELALLAIAIKLFTGILSGFGKSRNEAAVKTDSVEDENYAIILAVMNEELNSTGLKYQVTSIKETDY